MGDLAPAQTFARRQVVEVKTGPRVERAVIIGAHPAEPGFIGWYAVQFDDARLSVHASNMRASGERPFKGALRAHRRPWGGRA